MIIRGIFILKRKQMSDIICRKFTRCFSTYSFAKKMENLKT